MTTMPPDFYPVARYASEIARLKQALAEAGKVDALGKYRKLPDSAQTSLARVFGIVPDLGKAERGIANAEKAHAAAYGSFFGMGSTPFALAVADRRLAKLKDKGPLGGALSDLTRLSTEGRRMAFSDWRDGGRMFDVTAAVASRGIRERGVDAFARYNAPAQTLFQYSGLSVEAKGWLRGLDLSKPFQDFVAIVERASLYDVPGAFTPHGVNGVRQWLGEGRLDGKQTALFRDAFDGLPETYRAELDSHASPLSYYDPREEIQMALAEYNSRIFLERTDREIDAGLSLDGGVGETAGGEMELSSPEELLLAFHR